MSILPVLDLMDGQIVRGVAGERDRYRPIVSKIVDSAEPLAVARAIHDRFGFTEFYVADLDAIRGSRPAFDVHRRLRDEGYHLWIDAGLRTSHDDAIAILAEGDAAVIVGLESILDPGELHHIVRHLGPERVVFSLDLKDGVALGSADAWGTDDPLGIAKRAIVNMGVRRLIVLDLAHVGMTNGVGTEALCVRLKRQHPETQISTGGGVRGIEDVRRLHDRGVNYVLIASALHDGSIPPSPLGGRGAGGEGATPARI